MKKEHARWLCLGSGMLCLAAGVLPAAGFFPSTAAAAILILSFPPFVIALGLCWKAGEHESDIPFLGW